MSAGEPSICMEDQLLETMLQVIIHLMVEIVVVACIYLEPLRCMVARLPITIRLVMVVVCIYRNRGAVIFICMVEISQVILRKKKAVECTLLAT